MSVEIDVDLTIVGAGPTGLYAAYYAGFRGMRAAIVDTLELAGGQITALYPEKPIYDVAGFPSVLGRELVDRLVAQAKQFDHTWLLGQRAETLDRVGIADGAEIADGDGGRWVMRTSESAVIRCGAVVVCGGVGGFTPRPLPACAEFVGRGVEMHVVDLASYVGADVVIVGGGDSAVDWALALEGVADTVTLVHRRAQFRAHAHSVHRLGESSVRVITDAEVTAARGDEWISGVDVAIRGGDAAGAVESLAVDRVIAALGFVANLGPLAAWNLPMAGRGIEVDQTMSTGLPGIYAAGDIATYTGKTPLISVGFGEAATAVNHAFVHLNPSAAVFPGHSTDAGPAPASQSVTTKASA